MKRLTLFSLMAITLSFAVPQFAHAQLGKALGKATRYVGKHLGAGAVEAIAGIAVNETWEAAKRSRTNGSVSGGQPGSQYSSITVRIINNYNYPVYFWATDDGYNWYPQQLYSNQYIDLAGSQGVMGIFNGYYVTMLNQGGTYYASGF